MAFANVVTFEDPNEWVWVATDDAGVYIYWQVGIYLKLSHDEALKLRDDLSAAILEAATAAAKAKAEEAA